MWTTTPGRLRVRRWAAGLLAASALLLAACGGGGGGGGETSQQGNPQTQTPGASGQTQTPETQQQVDGKKIFTANCGTCHTLADAGTNGKIGPNLDDLQPDQARVERQVTNGGGGMPAFKGRLSQQEITAVAQYVSQTAGGS